MKHADQAACAILVVAAVGLLAAWWLRNGGLAGGVIEIDRQPPLHAVFIVDINSADWPELALLPGIGEGLARRIVTERDLGGPFVDHDDLSRVHGIGPVTLERMKPYLRPVPQSGALAGQ